jgi:expansin (peptidoglycan-binding protein)
VGAAAGGHVVRLAGGSAGGRGGGRRVARAGPDLPAGRVTAVGLRAVRGGADAERGRGVGPGHPAGTVPRMAEPPGHRTRRRRPVVLVAGALTAVVVAGAGVLVAAVRGGGTPAPRSLDRAVPSVTAPTTRAPVRPAPTTRTPVRPAQPAPVAAGTLRAAPVAPASPTAASRERRTAPAPATPAAAGAARRGTATFYTLAGLPNCGYPDAAAAGTYVALSPADFAGSAACGTVLDVTGPEGTVRVTVSDQCPECEPGHLDLAAPAFARIADPVAGIVPITFTRVVDPPTAGPVRVRVKEGSSPYWLALLPIDTGNPLVSVSVRGTALARTDYGYWVAEAGAGPGPYQVRLTDDRGHAATVTVPLSVGSTVPTGVRLY